MIPQVDPEIQNPLIFWFQITAFVLLIMFQVFGLINLGFICLPFEITVQVSYF